MDNEVYIKTHKRIRELNGFIAESGDPLNFMFGAERARWSLPVDSTNTGSSTGINDSRRIPMDRVLVLAQNRLVPGVNLPSYISRIDGCVEVTSYADLPNPGSIDYVYKVRENDITTFYRWVEDSDQGTAGYFPIRSNYVVVDGEGTVISDNDAAYTREIDVAVGDPSAHNSKILAIANNRLVHTKSGVGNADVTVPTPATVTSFGDSFGVPSFTVDSSGHINSLTETTVTIPSTAASTSDQGLVRIGDVSDIQPVGPDNTIGTASSDGYILLAPADHAHSAAPVAFTNLPTGDISYRMSSPVTLDMKDTIMALPPSNAQNALVAGMFLSATTQSGNDWNTLWKTAGQYFQTTLNESANGSSSTLTDSGTGVQLKSVPVKSNTVYLVSADMVLTVVNPLGAASTVSNLPNVYECTFSFNDSLSVERAVLVPGASSYSLPFKTTVSCMVKTAASQSTLVLSARVDDNVFSGTCTRLTAQELR